MRFGPKPPRSIHRARSSAFLHEPLESRRLLAGNVYQFHNDLPGTGVNANETVLTPSNVNTAQFGKHWSTPVDGQVYAQPLYVSNLNITTGTGAGVHNVTFVATEHDSVYAIDGDAGSVLWKTSVLGAGETTMPSSETGSGDITVEIGITGTPVIDPATNTLYVAAKSKQVISGTNHYYYKLHALDLGSGVEKFGGPVEISDTAYNGSSYSFTNPLAHPYVIGTGSGKITTTINGVSRTIIPFNAMRQMNRPGLTLYNGQVYIAFASHGDNGPYHGWVLRYDVPDTNDPAARMTLTGVLNTTPNASSDVDKVDGRGGIWQSGGALAFDPQGNFYFETGNGSFSSVGPFDSQGFPADANYGDSFLKVSNDPASTASNPNRNGWGMKVADYFTPFNEEDLDAVDRDLGSGGPTVLPDSVGSAAHPHLLVGSGKEGKIYLIDRDNMGKVDPATDHVVQEQAGAISGSLGVPAFFNNRIYYVGGYGGTAKTFSIGNGQFSTTPTSQSANNFAFPGSTPSITANGAANGVVWTIDRGTNQLRAYNANSYAQLLWTSAQAPNNRDLLGTVVKFSVPTAVDGKVFVGTDNALVSYGPPVPPTTVPATPTNLTATTRFATEIDLAWTDAATNEALYHIERSTNGTSGWSEIGTAGVNETSFIDSTAQPVTHYYYRVNASNGLGDSGYSNVADATTASAPPPGAGDGLLGQYFDNMDFTGTSVTRVDPTVNFDWGSGSPDPRIDVNTFSVRWTGQVQAQFGETYTFYTQSDDGVRLYVNNQLVIDNFTDHSSTENSGTITLAAGRNYPIRVEYYENSGGALAQLRWSSPSTPKQVVPKAQLFSGAAPAAPTSLTAVPASATQINLAWKDNSNNESGFLIERKTGAAGTFAQVAQVGPNVTSYMDTGLAAAATYVYRVRAANFGSNSPYSNEVTATLPTAPPTPSNAHATDVTNHTLRVVWQDNSDNEDGFSIFRKRSDSDTFIFVATVPANTSFYDDSGLAADTKYDYHIQAGNVAGFSDFAGFLVITATDAPTNLTATAGDGQVNLTWTAPSGATSYNVYRTTGVDVPWQLLRGGVATTAFTDSTVANGTTYFYEVKAVNGTGVESAESDVDSATPSANPGTHVSSVTVASDRWSAVFLGYLASKALGTDGFALPPGGAALAAPLPWSGLNQVRVHFDKDVPVARGDLVISGGGTTYPVTGFDYNPATHTATWTIGAAMANNRLSVQLAGDATRVGYSQSWADLQSDVDRSGAVNALDVADVRRRLNHTAGSPGTGSGAYSPFADVNGDGRIDARDLATALRDQHNTLPAQSPALPQPAGATAPPRRDRPVTRTFFG
jgi:fibronectin type 3 domain-containing protein